MELISPSRLVVTTIKKVAYHFIIFHNLFLANHNCEKLVFFSGSPKNGNAKFDSLIFSPQVPYNVLHLKRRNIFPQMPTQYSPKAFVSNCQFLSFISQKIISSVPL